MGKMVDPKTGMTVDLPWIKESEPSLDDIIEEKRAETAADKLKSALANNKFMDDENDSAHNHDKSSQRDDGGLDF